MARLNHVGIETVGADCVADGIRDFPRLPFPGFIEHENAIHVGKGRQRLFQRISPRNQAFGVVVTRDFNRRCGFSRGPKSWI